MTWPQRNTLRNPANYRLACLTELAAPLLRVYAGQKARTAPTPPTVWRKALLLGANHIGDLLYRTSSLAALKRGLPGCEFDFVAPAPACEVLEGNPHLRQIHRFEIPRNSSDPGFKALQAEEYDAAICYDTGMAWRNLKLGVDLGIPNRAGYVHKGFSGWVTFPVSIQYPQPFPAYFRDMVSQLTGLAPEWDLKPDVTLSPQNEQEADALWNEFGFGANDPVLACFVTTRQPTGVWPIEKFIETLRLAQAAKPSLQIVLCGAPGDQATLEKAKAELGASCRVNAGRLGLRALVTFLKKCRAVLCTDSGPRHLANAAGIPVVYLRNLRSSKIETGSYLPTEHDLAPDVEFVAPENQAPFLDLTTPASVAAEITRLL